MRLVKLILTDLAGFGLIVLALLTGWLPGPGGIPLFLAGLGLLSINHAWARRFLGYLKTKGLKLAEAFFKDHRVLVLVYDILALLLLIAGVIVLNQIHGILKGSATILFFLSLTLFLGNRRRLQKILKYFRRENQEEIDKQSHQKHKH